MSHCPMKLQAKVLEEGECAVEVIAYRPHALASSVHFIDDSLSITTVQYDDELV